MIKGLVIMLFLLVVIIVLLFAAFPSGAVYGWECGPSGLSDWDGRDTGILGWEPDSIGIDRCLISVHEGYLF